WRATDVGGFLPDDGRVGTGGDGLGRDHSQGVVPRFGGRDGHVGDGPRLDGEILRPAQGLLPLLPEKAHRYLGRVLAGIADPQARLALLVVELLYPEGADEPFQPGRG